MVCNVARTISKRRARLEYNAMQLNRDNPLGSGGKLAEALAALLQVSSSKDVSHQDVPS